MKRDVALKVLLPTFARDPERYARFKREAEVLASLNHPNIATLYGLAEDALIMEFVEGETLPCPLPLDSAIKYAKQIAEALEYAHERGVIHRDLKPANIKVTPDGLVKLLDFGLAKALDNTPAATSSSDAAHSPTLTLGHTMAGQILGTAAYMSPEQIEGRAADRRADIWSFGAVLFEMLAGQRAFEGSTNVETLASVVKLEPDWSALPKDTPSALVNLIRRCLTKDRRQRLQAIGEARIALENPALGDAPPVEAGPPVAKTQPTLWIALAGVFAIAALGLGYVAYRHTAEPAPIVTRFSIPLGEGQTFTSTLHRFVAISPGGTQIAYVANNRLYLRSMGDPEARAISGTDLSGGIYSPVFSPDGKTLAFYAPVDNTVKRVAVSGGAAVTICPLPAQPASITWGPDGILFPQPEGILRVSPNGGKPELVVKIKDNEQVEEPQMLPGGQGVLFTLATGANPGGAAWEKAQGIVQTLKTGVRKTVVEVGSDAHYLPTGHLVYAQAGVLYAIAFDLSRLETSGGPVRIVEGVARVTTGSAQFAFSGTGSLIYLPGPVTGSRAGGARSLVRADRKGNVEPFNLPPAAFNSPRVSRDGKRVAYQIDDGKETSIWIWDLTGATAPRRLTLAGTGTNRYPIWTADGERVAFQSDREGDEGIWWQRADGSGTAERLTKAEKGERHLPESWSPDGQRFSFSNLKGNSGNGGAVWVFSLPDKKATLFAEGPGGRGFAMRSAFSPDGHWVAYSAGDPQTHHIFVKPFPPTANPYQISTGAGDHHPVWSPDGKELFYVLGIRTLAAVTVTTKPSLSFSAPVEAPSGFATATIANPRNFDMLPDGKHFIGMVAAGEAQNGSAAAPQFQVVLNWFEEVRSRAGK